MASLVGSDKTIKGNTTKARVVSKKKPWKDLDLNFVPHPIRGDLVPLRDDNAIKQAVRNLLVSNFCILINSFHPFSMEEPVRDKKWSISVDCIKAFMKRFMIEMPIK